MKFIFNKTSQAIKNSMTGVLPIKSENSKNILKTLKINVISLAC